MTGFDVAAIAPLKNGHGAAKLGLRPLEPALWRDTGPELAARASDKAAVFAAHPEALHEIPAHAAAAELAALIGAPGPTLRDAACAMFEDVCILERRADGPHIFTAGALAYPTDWHLHEKIGQPLETSTARPIAINTGLRSTIKLIEKTRSKVRLTILHGNEISDFSKVRNGMPS